MREMLDGGKWINDMDGVFEWLKVHYQYVLIAGGLLFLIGAIRDWKWVYQATGGDKARHAFILKCGEKKGYRVFRMNHE